MKEHKDIFDLFKENEHKLNELPSESAWHRLENRLDNRHIRSRRTPQIRNWLSMAGVLLLLITLISVLSLFFQQEPKSMANAKSLVSLPIALEEIGMYSEETNPAHSIGSYKKQLIRLNTNPFLEGDPSKDLRVQKSVLVALRNRSINSKNNLLSKPVDKNIVPLQSKNNATSHAEMESTDVDFGLGEGLHSGRTEIISSDQASREKTIATSNDIIHDSVVPSIGIDQFQWILGRWEAPLESAESTDESSSKSSESVIEETKEIQNTPSRPKHLSNGVSIEEWKNINSFSIEGKGFILIDNQTKFIESMRIEQIGGDLFYFLEIDNNDSPLKYKLVSYNSEEFTFENQSLSFPNQVILQYNKNNNSFTTLLQNKTPIYLNQEQQKYFQQRNEINKEQIRRVMKRS